jgi:hypothetical protein
MESSDIVALVAVSSTALVGIATVVVPLVAKWQEDRRRDLQERRLARMTALQQLMDFALSEEVEDTPASGSAEELDLRLRRRRLFNALTLTTHPREIGLRTLLSKQGYWQAETSWFLPWGTKWASRPNVPIFRAEREGSVLFDETPGAGERELYGQFVSKPYTITGGKRWRAAILVGKGKRYFQQKITRRDKTKN